MTLSIDLFFSLLLLLLLLLRFPFSWLSLHHHHHHSLVLIYVSGIIVTSMPVIHQQHPITSWPAFPINFSLSVCLFVSALLIDSKQLTHLLVKKKKKKSELMGEHDLSYSLSVCLSTLCFRQTLLRHNHILHQLEYSPLSEDKSKGGGGGGGKDAAVRLAQV